MMDERSEFEKRLESMAKRHDHMERARRQEERALLLLAFDDEQAADRAAHEARTEELKAQMREPREHALAEPRSISRIHVAHRCAAPLPHAVARRCTSRVSPQSDLRQSLHRWRHV